LQFKLILEAIIALPVLLKEIKGVGSDIAKAIDKLRNQMTDKYIGELKGDIVKTLKKIKGTKNDDELKKLLADLNDYLNK